MSPRIRSDRLGNIWCGYTVSALTAGGAIGVSIAVLSVLGPGRAAASLLTQIGTGFALAALAAVFAIPFTFLLALLPAAAVILYAEPRGVRSPVAYALLGVLVAVVSASVTLAFFLDMITFSPPRPPRTTPPAETIRQFAAVVLLFILPGLCGGLTYWAKAGRYAGGTKPPSSAATATA